MGIIILAALIALLLATTVYFVRRSHRAHSVDELLLQLRPTDLTLLQRPPVAWNNQSASDELWNKNQIRAAWRTIADIRHNAAIVLALMDSCAFPEISTEDGLEIAYNLKQLREAALSARINGLLALIEIARLWWTRVLWKSAVPVHAVNTCKQYREMMLSGVQICLIFRPEWTDQFESVF